MGMFPKGTDNTDINKTARSNHTEGERFVAAATDFGATPPSVQLSRASHPPCTPLAPPSCTTHSRTHFSHAPQPPKDSYYLFLTYSF